MIRPALCLTLALLPLLAGCKQPTAESRASAATKAECRAAADRVYAAQNRGELSQRDQRDTPFAASYNSGITTRGLSSLFGRDSAIASCVTANSEGAAGSPDNSTGPTFQQQAR